MPAAPPRWDPLFSPPHPALSSLADERDRVQKKTFTKWVNKHLIKVRARAAFCRTPAVPVESPRLCRRQHLAPAHPQLRPCRASPAEHPRMWAAEAPGSAVPAQLLPATCAGAPAASAADGQRLRPLGCLHGGLWGWGQRQRPLQAGAACPASLLPLPGCAVPWPCQASGQAGSCRPPPPTRAMPAPGVDGALAPGTRGPFAGFDAAEPGSSAGRPLRPGTAAASFGHEGARALPACPGGAVPTVLPALGSACPARSHPILLSRLQPFPSPCSFPVPPAPRAQTNPARALPACRCLSLPRGGQSPTSAPGTCQDVSPAPVYGRVPTCRVPDPVALVLRHRCCHGVPPPGAGPSRPLPTLGLPPLCCLS